MEALLNTPRERVRALTLFDITDGVTSVAERFLALWRGDDIAAKESLLEMGVQPDLAHMLCLAIDTLQRRRQRELDLELNGYHIRRGQFRYA